MSPNTPQPTNPLDTILEGLRSTEPTPGFEERLHARLQAASAEPTPQPAPRRPRVLTLTPFAAALAAALLLAVFLSRPHTPAPRPTPSVTAPPAITPPQPPLLVHQAAVAHARRTPRTRPEPTLAVAETSAPSQPPPPLPLTAEERNIQRFRSLHSAVSLAALSPEAISAHTAADRQALHDFFDPTHQEN